MKFILNCIFKGIIPVITAIIIFALLLSFITLLHNILGEFLMLILSIVMIILLLSFLVGFIKNING